MISSIKKIFFNDGPVGSVGFPAVGAALAHLSGNPHDHIHQLGLVIKSDTKAFEPAMRSLLAYAHDPHSQFQCEAQATIDRSLGYWTPDQLLHKCAHYSEYTPQSHEEQLFSALFRAFSDKLNQSSSLPDLKCNDFTDTTKLTFLMKMPQWEGAKPQHRAFLSLLLDTKWEQSTIDLLAKKPRFVSLLHHLDSLTPHHKTVLSMVINSILKDDTPSQTTPSVAISTLLIAIQAKHPKLNLSPDQLAFLAKLMMKQGPQ